MYQHNKPRYPVQDLLTLLSIGRSRLYSDINTGILKTYKVGKRRFASPEALDAYVAAKEAESQQ
jgi:hypothetical protein